MPVSGFDFSLTDNFQYRNIPCQFIADLSYAMSCSQKYRVWSTFALNSCLWWHSISILTPKYIMLCFSFLPCLPYPSWVGRFSYPPLRGQLSSHYDELKHDEIISSRRDTIMLWRAQVIWFENMSSWAAMKREDDNVWDRMRRLPAWSRRTSISNKLRSRITCSMCKVHYTVAVLSI